MDRRSRRNDQKSQQLKSVFLPSCDLKCLLTTLVSFRVYFKIKIHLKYFIQNVTIYTNKHETLNKNSKSEPDTERARMQLPKYRIFRLKVDNKK